MVVAAVCYYVAVVWYVKVILGLSQKLCWVALGLGLYIQVSEECSLLRVCLSE